MTVACEPDADPVTGMAEPASTVEAEGFTLLWHDGTVVAHFTEDLAVLPDGTAVFTAQQIRRVSDAGWRLQQAVLDMTSAHQSFRAHPGRFGAVPDRPFGAREHAHQRTWLAAGHTLFGTPAFGTPMLTFTTPPGQEGIWSVTLAGFGNNALRTIAWDDTEQMAETVALLDDIDFWHVAAALEHHAQWAYALEQEAKRAERALQDAARRRALAAAVTALGTTPVNTRRLMPALRKADLSSTAVRSWNPVEVRHCDVWHNGTKVRIAEQLRMAWTPTATRADRRAFAEKVRTAVTRLGYSVVLTKGGHIYIAGAAREALSEHLPAVSRVASDSRVLVL